MDFYPPPSEECPPSRPDMKSWEDGYPHYESMDHSPSINQNMLSTGHYVPASPTSSLTGSFFNPFSYGYPPAPSYSTGGMEDGMPGFTSFNHSSLTSSPSMPMQASFPTNSSPPSSSATTTAGITKEESTTDTVDTAPSTLPPPPPSSAASTAAEQQPQQQQSSKSSKESKRAKKKNISFDKLNISDLINENELDADTLSAQKAERDRMERILNAQKRAQQESQQRAALLRQQQEYHRRLQQVQRVPEYGSAFPMDQQRAMYSHSGTSSHHLKVPKGSRSRRAQQQEPRFPKSQTWAVPNLPSSSPSQQQSPKENNATFSSSLPSPGTGGSSSIESPPQHQVKTSPPSWAMPSMHANEVALSHSNPPLSQEESSSSSHNQEFAHSPASSSTSNPPSKSIDSLPPPLTQETSPVSPPLSSPSSTSCSSTHSASQAAFDTSNIKKEPFDSSMQPPDSSFFPKPQVDQSPKRTLQQQNVLLNRQLDGFLGSSPNVKSFGGKRDRYPPFYPHAVRSANKEVILIDSSEEEDEGVMKAKESQDIKRGIKKKDDFQDPWINDGSPSSQEVIDVSSGSEMGEDRRPRTKPGLMVPIKEEPISGEDDDDVVMLSNEEESESESSNDETDMSGSHINDFYNQIDAEGRVLVNVGHPPEDPDIFLAPQITRAIKPHQVGGIRFLWDNVVENLERFRTSPGFGCILAHSMGLGKTVQVISFIDVFLTHTGSKNVVCVVPINTIQNWKTEFDMWTPPKHMVHEMYVQSGEVRPRNYETFILNDNYRTLAARVELIRSWNERGGVMLMGYEMYRMLALKQVPKTKKKTKQEAEADSNEVLNKQYFDEIHKSLVDPGPDLIICDEGHRIKNASANTSQALKNIRTRRRVVLTGYPLQNSLLEYWCMVDFIRPNYLGSKSEFCNMFERPITNGQCIDSTPRDRQLMRFRSHVLHSLLQGFVQRRGHSVLRASLPNKDEHVILIRMSDIQRKLYKAFVSDLLTVQNAVNPLKLFAVCCKIWNHPDVLYDMLQNQRQIVQGDDNDLDIDVALQATKPGRKNSALRKKDPNKNGFIQDPAIPPYRDKIDPSINYDWANPLMADYIPGQLANSYKLTIMFAILEQTLAAGDKMLVFSQSLFTLSLIEKFLSVREVPYRPPGMPPEKWARNKNYYRLDGSTNAQDREKMIQDFNGNPNIVLFLLSTRAGCLGINLIGANRIIVLDASWNPCHDAQAVCRIYRYGQIKPCFIYRLITDNSLEKRIYDRQINKQGMSDRVVDELTPECNFTMKEVNTLTHENEEDNPVKDYSEVVDTFNDHILKYIYSNFNYCLSKEPFEHESLLSDRKDLKLTKQEKRMAKKSYEMEKRANMHNYRGASHAGFMPSSVNISPNLIRPWLLPSQMTPSMQDGSKPGGMLGNLLKPGCSVQKIKVPQDVTIPVTTPGLPPVHIKAGQEVLVMKTPKGMCLQLPGGRLVAIHFNPATLGGGDKGILDGKGKPVMPMKNRIVQPSLHCGGMVRMRPGSSVLKRPTEVINLSDDNDSDVESTKTVPPKPSISITPVSVTSGTSQPPPMNKQQKKPLEGNGEKKWPSSLSNLNLPSNLSVSILPVSSSGKTTSTTSSSPSSAKLIKLNSGERSSLPGLPSGIDVSILSTNKARQQQPQQHKVTKVAMPQTSASISLLPKTQSIDADLADKSPLINIPAGVSILPFSKPSPSASANKTPPNVTLFSKSDQQVSSKGFPSNLDISIFPSTKLSDSSLTMAPSDKEMSPNNTNSMAGLESSLSGEAAINQADQHLDKEGNLASENLSLETDNYDPQSDHSAPSNETNDFSKELGISQNLNMDPLNHTQDQGIVNSNDTITPEEGPERKDERAVSSGLQDSLASSNFKESGISASSNSNYSSKDDLPGTSIDISYGQNTGVSTTNITQSQEHLEVSHPPNSNENTQPQNNESMPSQQQQHFSMTHTSMSSEAPFISPQANRAAYSSFSQESLSRAPHPSEANMSYQHSSPSTSQSQPSDVNQYFDQFTGGSQNKNAQHSTPPSSANIHHSSSITGTITTQGPQENQLLTSNDTMNQSFSPDKGASANMPQSKLSSGSHHSNLNFSLNSQVPSHMAQAGASTFTNDSYSSGQSSQGNSHPQTTSGKPASKSKKNYKKNAKKASNKSNNSYSTAMNNSQLFNPLSWQNAHLEEGNNLSSPQYANQGAAQANIYSQKSFDNTSWGTTYQMGSENGQTPTNKNMTSEGFGNWQMGGASGNQDTGLDSGSFQRNAPPSTTATNMADISSSFNNSSWPVSSSISTSSSDNLLTNTWASNNTVNTSQQSFQGQAWGNGTASGTSPKNMGDQASEIPAKSQQGWAGYETQQSGSAPASAPSEWSGSSTSYLNLDSEKGTTSSIPGSSSLTDWFHDTDLGFGTTNWSNSQDGAKTSLSSTSGNTTQPVVSLPNTSEGSSETASFWSDSFTTLLQDSANSGGGDASWTGQYNNWAGGNEGRDWAAYNNTSSGNDPAASTSYQPPAWPNPASYLDDSTWRGGAQQDLWPSGFDWASSQTPDLPPPT